jgi:hypothetical protein
MERERMGYAFALSHSVLVCGAGGGVGGGSVRGTDGPSPHAGRSRRRAGAMKRSSGGLVGIGVARKEAGGGNVWSQNA